MECPGNDPAQHYGNEQHSHFESTCVLLNGRVIVGYVDSNQLPGAEPRSGGVYALGANQYLSARTPRLVGYDVSRNGGVTFDDNDVPPLATAGGPTDDDGDAGDPVLAVDRVSGAVYLVGTSPRNAGRKGIPLWKSTDGGATFGQPIIVRDEVLTSDKLLVAWYDRRNDSNNSLIDVYGRWATIPADGNVSFGGEFKITTTSFPPVFAGTLPANRDEGHYDPVYPPGLVNLSWWHPDWPEVGEFGDPVVTFATYEGHVGEYNGAWADGGYAYLTWTDHRLQASGTEFNRHQSDIRMVRITWPQ